MIEATLDQTLIQKPSSLNNEQVERALQQFNSPTGFADFIQGLVKETGAPRSEVQDVFWRLLHTGKAVLTPDLKVAVRR